MVEFAGQRSDPDISRSDNHKLNGLGMLQDRLFRIRHFGALQLIGTLGGVEMGLRVAGVPHKSGGLQVAIDFMSGNA